jgi:Ricin-type beta-trefoil lectin domain
MDDTSAAPALHPIVVNDMKAVGEMRCDSGEKPRLFRLPPNHPQAEYGTMNLHSLHLIILTSAVGCAFASACGGGPGGLANPGDGSPSSASAPPPKTTVVVRQLDGADTFTGTAKTIVDETGAISNIYGTFQAAQALATALGILDSPDHDMLTELQALHAQIDQVAGELTYLVVETDRETRLNSLLSIVHTTHDALVAGQTIDWFLVDTTSAQLVSDGEDPTSFERNYIDQDGALMSELNYSQADLGYNHGLIYDWRLGLPAFTQLIGLRIQLMAMEDSNFTTDGRFHDELMGYHDALQNTLSTMNGGVRNNVIFSVPNPDDPNYVNESDDFATVCADIFSGLIAAGDVPFSDSACCTVEDDQGNQALLDPTSPQYASAYQTWYQTNVQSMMDAECQNVRFNMMPTFETQALINTLYLYANGITDLTVADHAIHSAGNPNLCIDVPWGSTAQGTQVQLYNCNWGTFTQTWQYDRYNQRIVESGSGLCLDVQWGNSVPGTPVWTWPCIGTPAQRWSYDAQLGILENSMGTVLDVPAFNFAPNQLLQTWSLNNGTNQHWQ